MNDAPSPRSLAIAATIFYSLMSVLGLWTMATQDIDVFVAVFGDGTDVLRDTLLGAGSGLVVVGITWCCRNMRAVTDLNREFGEVIGEPSTMLIALLALTSSIGEEVLFRGGLQPLIGFWWTVTIFGLLHGGAARKYRVWAIFATAAGVLLGWLADFTGNLLAPILCHLTVNYFNLHLVARSHSGSS